MPGVAQVNNVDQVEVDLDGSDDVGNTLTIDNRNGRVTEPGFTQNEVDINEIEFLLENVDNVVYEDTEATGAITIGDDGVGDAIPPGALDILDRDGIDPRERSRDGAPAGHSRRPL